MWEGTFYLVVVLMMAAPQWSTQSGVGLQMLSLEMESEKACQLALNQMDRQIKSLHGESGWVKRYSLTCIPKNEKKEND